MSHSLRSSCISVCVWSLQATFLHTLRFLFLDNLSISSTTAMTKFSVCFIVSATVLNHNMRKNYIKTRGLFLYTLNIATCNSADIMKCWATKQKLTVLGTFYVGLLCSKQIFQAKLHCGSMLSEISVWNILCSLFQTDISDNKPQWSFACRFAPGSSQELQTGPSERI